MYEMIISILAIVALVIMFIQNKTNRKKLEEEISELKNETFTITKNVDILKNTITQKEIFIAEVNKDKESYLSKLDDNINTIDSLEDEIIELNKLIEEKKDEIINLNDYLKDKEYLIEHAKVLDENNVISLNKDKELLSIKITQQNEDIIESKSKIELLTGENLKLHSLNAKFIAELNAQKENNVKLKESFDEQTQKSELKIAEIMQKALDSKLKKFDESSMKSLDGILKPFKENLELFRKKVDDSQESSIQKFAELSKEIELVAKAGMNISKEAENLTQALKGKKQTQGSWGEMILETVLEYSGLLKGVHFETQTSYKDESGNLKRPDVVINLPQKRSMIIDSKVSLNDYDRYIRAETNEERQVASKGVAKAFRDQIDNLDSKDYSHYKIGTLQYVFMFVPVEGAFSLAVQEDPSLYEYALKKHIAIVNPSTLTVSLRTIYLYWQSEQSNTLAIKLFSEAGKLYDKMHTFTESFVKIGSQLQTVNKTYENATKQLTEGTGNLLGRVENLKKLGARTSKSLNDSKIEYQDFDVDNVEVKIIYESNQLALD